MVDEGAKIREVALAEGLQAYRVKVLTKKKGAPRLDVLTKLAEATGTSFVDPINGKDLEAHVGLRGPVR